MRTDVLTYREKMFTRLLEAGPYPGEDFFRLKVTGNGESHWVNISPEELRSIIDLLSQNTDKSF